MPYFYLRIPHFPAWALAQTDSSLQGKASQGQAFAICERGQVIAASPLARQAGVVVGMTNGRATSRLSSLLILSRDKSCEAIAWYEVQRMLYGLTPKIEPIQPGHLFCDLIPDKAKRLLYLWNRGDFGVSGGVAGDRATAHLAALQAPAGTCRAVKAGAEWNFAGKVTLDSLHGAISEDTITCLKWFGWTTIASIRPLNRRQLEEQFDGKGMGKDGVTLFRLAQGAKHRDNLRPVATWQPREEITARIEFELPAREPAEWNQGLVDTLLTACVELGPRSAQTIEITAQTPIAPVTARRVLREPASNPKTLIHPLQSALEEALRSLLPLPAIVQGFEIRLGGLTVPDVQSTLWEDPHARRHQKLSGALERIESRLPGKVQSLVPQQSDSPFEEDQYGWVGALERLGASKRTEAKGHANTKHAHSKHAIPGR